MTRSVNEVSVPLQPAEFAELGASDIISTKATIFCDLARTVNVSRATARPTTPQAQAPSP